MALAPDGSASNYGASVTSIAATLSTTKAGDIIVAVVSGAHGDTCSVTGSGGTGPFLFKGQETVAAGTIVLGVYVAFADDILTNEVITAWSLAAQNMQLAVFAVSGGTSWGQYPWDTGISVVPVSAGNSTSPVSTALSTVQSDDMVIACLTAASSTTVTEPAGFTDIYTDSSGPTLSVCYEVVSGTVSGATYDWTLGTSEKWATVVVAVAGSAPTAPTGPLFGKSVIAKNAGSDTISVTIGPIKEASAILINVAWAGTIPNSSGIVNGDLVVTDGTNNYIVNQAGQGAGTQPGGGGYAFSWDPDRSSAALAAGTYTITVTLPATPTTLIVHALEVQSNNGSFALAVAPEGNGGTGIGVSPVSTVGGGITIDPTWDNTVELLTCELQTGAGVLTAAKGQVVVDVPDSSVANRVVTAIGYAGAPGGTPTAEVHLTWPTSSYTVWGANILAWVPPFAAPAAPTSTLTVDRVINGDQVLWSSKLAGLGDQNIDIGDNGFCVFGRPSQSFAILGVPANTKLALFVAYAPGSLGQYFHNYGDYYPTSVTDTLGTTFTRLAQYGSGDGTPPQLRVELWAGDVSVGGDDIVLLTFTNPQGVGQIYLVPVVLTKDSAITEGTAVGGGGTATNLASVHIPAVGSGAKMLAFFGMVTDDYSGVVVTPNNGETSLLSSFAGDGVKGEQGCHTFPCVLLEELPSAAAATATYSAPTATTTYWAGLAIPFDPAAAPVVASSKLVRVGRQPTLYVVDSKKSVVSSQQGVY